MKGARFAATRSPAPINKTRVTLRSGSASCIPISLRFRWVMEKMQRRFGAGIGVWLRRATSAVGCTRGSLACGFCEFADWCNAKGNLRLASARRTLPALVADLGVRLPASRSAPPSARRPHLSERRSSWSVWTDFAPMMLLYRDFRTCGMDDESDELAVSI